MARAGLRSAVAGLVPLLLAACYSYTPLATTPAPNTRLALVLSDLGRVGSSGSLGAAVLRVEGTLVGVSDTGYVLRVSEVLGITGARTRWSGETVTVPREHVANTMERRFSRGRTAAAAAGVTGLFVAFVVSRSLFGWGGGDAGNKPPDDGGGSQ